VVGGTREITASRASEERSRYTCHEARRWVVSLQRRRLWSRGPAAVAGLSRQTREVPARGMERAAGHDPEIGEGNVGRRVRAGGGHSVRSVRRRTTRSSGPAARVARPPAADRDRWADGGAGTDDAIRSASVSAM
jgi:hypothetical protein